MKKKQETKAQEQQQAPQIFINAQYIKDLSLEVPLAPEIFKELNAAPQVDINVDIQAKHLEKNFFNVTLKMLLEGNFEEKKIFILELEYASVVTLNIPKEHIEPVLLIEIPRQMFPFARSIILHNLANAGLPPINLQPIDFAQIYARKKAN